MKKIIQIETVRTRSGEYILFALCADGNLWSKSRLGEVDEKGFPFPWVKEDTGLVEIGDYAVEAQQ